MCETKIKIAYIKKRVYKDRKETTHVEIGEEKHTPSYIYIYIYLKRYVQCMSINEWSQDQYT